MTRTADQTAAVAGPGVRELFLMVFLPFAAGYFLSYLFRSVNAVIATDLQADIGLSASALGLLTAAYFLSFALFQLPLGLLLDRFGARRVEAVLLLVAACGALVFSVSQSLAGLGLGRALIGLGVSACLMASFKAFTTWIPAQRLPVANGCLLAVGGLGAMAATRPVEVVLEWADWRALFVGLAVACTVVAAIVWRLVPEKDAPGGHEGLRDQLAGLRRVLAAREFWRLAPLAMVVQGGSLAIQGLWAGPWLRDVAGMERDRMAGTLLLIALAMTVGFAAWGIISERMQRLGVEARTVLASGIGLFLACELVLVLRPESGAVFAWMAFAFFAASGTLVYAMVSRAFPSAYTGRANTAINLAVFTGAFLLQWGMGFVIDARERADAFGYAPEGYSLAFGGLLVLQGAAYAWFLWPTEGGK